jgi:diguanylate cyclase (GGDEF)-like protein/PAS domain S-box-containing protein
MRAPVRRMSASLGKKRVEERPDSDATFRLLFASHPLPMWVYDLKTLRFLDVNEVACHTYGYTREEFLALTIRDIRPAEDISRLDDSVRTSDENSFNAGIWRHRKKDATILRVEILSHEIDYKGTRARLVCPIDVTERVQAEEARARLADALREREAGLHRAQIVAKLAHVITRPDGSFESWSETLPQLIGVDPAAIPRNTREWLDILHPVDRPIFRSAALEAAAKGTRVDVEYRLHRADHSLVYVQQVFEPLQSEPNLNGRMRWFSTLQDVTEQRRAEQRIQRLNRVYAVLSGINALIVRVRDRDDLFRDACRIAVEAGKFRLAWVGVVDKEAKQVKPIAWHGAGDNYIRLIPLGLDPAVPATFGMVGQVVTERKAMVADDMPSDPRVTLTTEAAQRDFRSLAILPLVASGEVAGVLALYAEDIAFFDAEEMKLLLELAGDIAFALDYIAKEEQLDYLAFYDPLTGVPNRNLFQERLAERIGAATREQRQLAVVLLDTERFNTINDSLGRQVGDELLKQVTARCLSFATDPGLFARLVGDQFAIVIPDVRIEDDVARIVEQRNREIFGAPYRIGDAELRISAKFGIAVFPGDGTDADTLLKNAEAALKRAKATGERYLFYTQQMSERVAGHLTLENKLRNAFERNEFVLYYQPKVGLETRRIVGVEALMRWQSPDLGLVQPLRFIPLLEETGMILDVGAWALRRAALDHQLWLEQNLAAPRIAVNVSAIQLRQRDFVDMVREAVRCGIGPPVIDIEITESVIVEDIESTIQKLRAIRDMGLNIAIDDFGTGYSSLGYLARLPVHSLKIDRSFIITMADEPDTMTLVSTIISLAHSLRLKICAEGVETEEQAKALRLMRCDEMQGYLISRPVPESELRAVLARKG